MQRRLFLTKAAAGLALPLVASELALGESLIGLGESHMAGSPPYIGEIRAVGFNFAPAGWMTCEGQLLPISENETLFMLIGTTYGGDGQSTFALPDLRGRVPIHMGQGSGLPNYNLGETGGAFAHTLTVNQLPAHTHPYTYQPRGQSSTGTTNNPENAYYAAGSGRGGAAYQPVANANTAMATTSAGAQTTATGGNQPISIAQPYLAMNYIISLFGVFPLQT
jgi:microcystin-dependent protein